MFSTPFLCVCFLLVFVKEMQLLDANFNLDSNGTMKTLMGDLGKEMKQLTDLLTSLNTHLGNEKVSMYSVQLAQLNATKQAEMLEMLKLLVYKKSPNRKRSAMTPRSIKSTAVSEVVEDTARSPMTDVPVKERKFTLVKTIATSSSLDEYPTYMYDLVVLNQKCKDVIVTTDLFTHSVKSLWFDPFKDRFLSSRLVLNLRNCDGRITKLSETQVAVLCRCRKIIHILNVSPRLSINKTITTQRSNCAITSMTSPTESGNEMFLVTGHESGMSIINMQGVVVKQMDIDIEGKKYVDIPYYLALTPTGNILLIDNAHWLLCVTQKREVLWKYEFDSLFDITCDPQGNVYITNMNANKVDVLSADGKFIKEVLSSSDHITKPNGIYYDANTGRLYVAECMSGLIKIFEQE